MGQSEEAEKCLAPPTLSTQALELAAGESAIWPSLSLRHFLVLAAVPGSYWPQGTPGLKSPGNLFLARGKEDQCSESMRVGGEAPGRYVETWFQDPSG